MVDPGAHELLCAEAGVGRDDWLAGLHQLRADGLIQLAAGEPGMVSLISVNNATLLDYLQASQPDLPGVERRLGKAVMAAAGQGPVDLAAAVDEPPLLVECLLDTWVSQRSLVYSKAPGRRFRVHRATLPDLPGTAASAPEAAAGEPAPTATQP